MSINNNATTLFSMGRLADAELLYWEALERRHRVLGSRHPGTIWSMHNYAVSLRSVGCAREAETLVRRAVSVALHDKNLGPRNPETRKYARTLARILLANNKPDEARAIAAEFDLPDPTTQPAATQPTTQPFDEARVAEIRAFVAKLQAEWNAENRATGATQPATAPN